jgi:predicted dehydrogenase
MKQYGAAIIGCGNIYNVHADAIMNSGHAYLAAVCDIDESRAKEAAKRYGCKWATDYMELLKDERIKTIHICTPHFLHAPMAITAMEHGRDVLTEKPAAINSKTAFEMVEASKRTGRHLGVCFQNRYNPTSQKVREILQSGAAGRILGAKATVTWNRGAEYYNSAEWRGTWEQEGGGVLINQAIHTLDLLQWFLGDVEKISGSAHTHLLGDIIEVEDTAEALIYFSSGARAIFYATNCYVSDSPPEIEIICEKASIKLCHDLTINYADGRKESLSDTDPKSGKKACWGSSHSRLIHDFYSCLDEGREFPVDAAEGIKALKMIEAINKRG